VTADYRLGVAREIGLDLTNGARRMANLRALAHLPEARTRSRNIAEMSIKAGRDKAKEADLWRFFAAADRAACSGEIRLTTLHVKDALARITTHLQEVEA
jgi:hypothetical protein